MYPTGYSIHADLGSANARAAKVAFYLGCPVSVTGRPGSEPGYTVSPDSPLVPGFDGANPYDAKRKV